ncbi:MAG: endonuclease III [Bdellovibrionales bacterium]|nr:endonuclease III [Bdellovibrionales bacterium]
MPRESLENKKKRVLKVIARLREEYPDAHCALDYTSPLELLVATILSAQCTDERVNLVTKKLFKRCRTARDYAEIQQEELEELIHSAGFYRSKAKSLKGMGLKLEEKHQGRVPKEMDELIALPGVGRKTANVVLGNAFDIPSGVVVDTHVGRLSRRLGFTKSENPVQIEKDLEKIVPQKNWILFSHWLIWHGRALCKARKAQCALCPIVELCPQIGLS